MGKTNYSRETSLPAYREDQPGKQAQKDRILQEMNRLGGAACLKQIEQFMHLPQSTCSGRMNDLINDKKIMHDGFVEYDGRLRKRFVIIKSNVVPITKAPDPVIEEPITPGQQQLKLG